MLKKIRNLLLFLLLLAGVGAYFGYDYLWQGTKQSLIPSMIPDDAVFVFEGTKLLDTYDNISEEKAVELIKQKQSYQKFSKQAAVLDQLLTQKDASLRKFLLGKAVYASFHLTAENKLYPILYIPVSGNETDAIKELYGENLGNSDESYHGATIYHPSHELAVNFLLEEGVLVASRSNELLKRVIDTRKKSKTVVKAHYEYLLKNETVVDGLHLYINYKQLPNLFQIDVKDPLLKKIQTFCDFSYLDISVKEDEVHFNGKSYASDSSVTFVSCFEGQTPQQLSFSDLVSNRTAFLYFWGYDKPTILRDELKKYWYDHQPEVLQEWENVKKYLKINLEQYYGFIGNQIGLAVLKNKEERLVYLEPATSGQTAGKFMEIATSVLTNGRELQTEEYVGYKITKIGIQEFPYLLFGEQFKGFEASFYTIIDGFIVIGNSTSVLKKLINDIEAEDVWGKSISQNAFMEKDLIESNISFFVKTDNTWDLLLKTASDEWSGILSAYEESYKTVEQAGIQFSYKEDILYTDLVLKMGGAGKQNVVEEQREVKHMEKQVFAYEFDSPIVSEPFVVKSHVDNSREVFVQTQDYKVHLLSGSGRLLWSKQLDTMITSEVIQVDVYQNNKLQYIFATPKAIHCIDRLGNDVEFYPVKIPEATGFIHQFNVIDYDNSKNYRLLTSTDNGDVYMFDIKGRNLEGWNPRKLDGILATAPEHIRISGKDFIVVVQQKGTFHLLNRRGDEMKHFPKQLGGKCNTNWYFDEGSNQRNSVIEIYAETGDAYRFNFKGKLDNTFLIPKTSMSRLEVVKSPSEKSYIVANVLPGKLAVYGDNKKLLFEKEMPISIASFLQLYNINGEKIIVATDQESKLTYFIKQNGELLTKPISCEQKIRLLYYSTTNSINVYKVLDKTISLNTIFLEK